MSRTPPRILIVEDDVSMQALLSMILLDEGYDIQTACNGEEALEAVGHRMPDLILLDMLMPVMDGWQFARTFHARYGAVVPIVVTTAAADARKRAKEVGAQGWVAKPFNIDTLLRAIGQALRQRSDAG